MKRSERIERNRKMIMFLASPISIDINGLPLTDNKGNIIYPTHREAGDKYGLEKDQVRLIKKEYIDLLNELKEKNLEGR